MCTRTIDERTYYDTATHAILQPIADTTVPLHTDYLLPIQH